MRARVAVGVVLVAYAVLCVSTLREGHTGGDFALYIMHAENIAAGRAFAATGFVYNPLNAIMSPAAYPPGFPLLLAPVAALAGPGLWAMKLVVVLTLVGSLFVFHALARPVLGRATALAVAAGSGLLPILFERRDLVLSDIPSLFWCLLALLCHDVLRRMRRASWPVLGLLALSVGMASATRTAGLVVGGAIVLACARRQGPWLATAVAAVAGAGAAVAAGRLLRVDSQTYIGYLAALQEQGPAGLLRDVIVAYGPGLAGAWGISAGPIGGPAVLGLMLVLTLAGWVLRVRADAGAPEAFLALYAAMLLVFPVRLEPVRYLVPVAPLLLYYPAVAIRRALPRGAPAAVVALVALLVAPYYAAHPWMRHAGPLVTGAESEALYEAVRRMAPSDHLVLSANPRVLAFMTRRRAAIWPENPTAESFAAFAAGSGASWAVEDRGAGNPSDVKAQGLLPGPGARAVWENDRYRLWRLTRFDR